MGQKDLTEKQLIGLKDIFADIINVFLFDGKRIMNENDLEDIDVQSFYEHENDTREQFRDVAKAWVKNHVRIAILGVENQTVPHKDMVLRCIGYDGAAYRDRIKPERKNKERYPVVTLVLYFGSKPWNEPLTLFERVKIPDELKPYVNDYKINLIELRNVTPEQVNLFQSDFRVVAEYFYQKNNNKEYKPDFETLKYVHEIINLMSELADKRDFDEFIHHIDKGCTTMGVYYQEILDKARLEGEARGER